MVSIKQFPHPQYSSEEAEVEEQGQGGISKRHLSKAANSHKFRKIQKPSKCRECDSYVYWQGYECADCGLASHKKCLETLHLLCGPKRLLRKMTTFGVDLGHHLLEVGAEIPPLVQRCVAVVDGRGTAVKGIYRVSGVKSKVEKLCQAFENISAEFVDLTDVHPNVIANVVKLYMRQLPEPLMTFRLYSEFIRVGRACPAPGTGAAPADEREAVIQLTKLCGQLPKHHYNTLGFLCHHLYRVAQQSEVNNMPASNLAIGKTTCETRLIISCPSFRPHPAEDHRGLGQPVQPGGHGPPNAGGGAADPALRRGVRPGPAARRARGARRAPAGQAQRASQRE